MGIPTDSPAFVLAENLKALLKETRMTGPECANQAGVARKTVNNMINARTDPTVESIQSVARVFNLECWQLLMPNTGSFKQWKAATELLRMFLTADERGQRLTLEIAQVSIRQSAGD